MRILITGGHGFIGGRLGYHLLQAGHQVILGSRNTSNPPNWLASAKATRIDWNDGPALEHICCGVDVVIQAAGVNAQDCEADPVAALEFNGLATARLLAAACQAGVKRFVYISTAHVYASPLVGSIIDDTCPRNLHPYATSHLAGENVVLRAGQRRQIEGIVVRLSNAFGAPMHKDVNCWTLLVNDLCRQAVETGKMALHSSGLQQRDFIAMAEVCRVVEHLSSCSYDSLLPGAFNVGSGVSQSVFEMAQLVQQRCKLILGFEPKIQRPESGVDERHEKLEYRSDRLANIGVKVSLDHNIEIDSLLAFCQAQASHNQNRSENA